MAHQKNNGTFFLSTGTVVLFGLLYALLVFKEWDNINDLFSLIPRFILLGLVLGFLSSVIPFKKPVASSFALGFFTPITTFLLYLSLELFISQAMAGKFSASKDDFAIWNFLFISCTSVLFGMLSILGNTIGLYMRNYLLSWFSSGQSNILLNSRSIKNISKNDSHKLTVFATILTSIISAIAVILSSFIKGQ